MCVCVCVCCVCDIAISSTFLPKHERHFIMQVVCEATQCADESVQVVALQNLVKIMSLYYQYMEAYMGPALFAVSPLLPVCSEREYYIKRNV